MLKIKNIEVVYNEVVLVIKGLSLEVNKGEIVSLLGANGAGKSTIFNLIIGLIKPKNGKIKILGKDVTNYPIYARTKTFRTGYCPQHGGFINDLSLLDNLKAISEIVLDNKNHRTEKINYLISKFEFDNLKDIKAKYLSGGQKKRLVIALALLGEPKVLLLDEIYAALDVQNRASARGRYAPDYPAFVPNVAPGHITNRRSPHD